MGGVTMKIRIIVHSQTGHTYTVAEKLKNKLTAGGHFVDLKKIEPVGGESLNNTDISKIAFDHQPNVSGYDAVIFCAPVRGGSISPVLAAYLAKIDTLKDKKVDLFVTQFFPYSWMGGKQAISQMRKKCEDKGAIIGTTGIVNWKNRKREKMIEEVVNKLCIR
jgi:menaquinone-dependent protoporphyrinogen IX oxidase